MVLGSGIRDPRSGIRKKPIPDPGSRGQKAPNPGSRIRIRNTGTSKIQKNTSALKREHPTLQNMIFLNFSSTFVGHFCPPESESPDSESGYGSVGGVR